MAIDSAGLFFGAELVPDGGRGPMYSRRCFVGLIGRSSFNEAAGTTKLVAKKRTVLQESPCRT